MRLLSRCFSPFRTGSKAREAFNCHDIASEGICGTQVCQPPCARELPGVEDVAFRATAHAACASGHELMLFDITGQQLVWCSAPLQQQSSPTLAGLLGSSDLAVAVLHQVALHGSWKGNVQSLMMDVVLAAQVQPGEQADAENVELGVPGGHHYAATGAPNTTIDTQQLGDYRRSNTWAAGSAMMIGERPSAFFMPSRLDVGGVNFSEQSRHLETANQSNSHPHSSAGDSVLHAQRSDATGQLIRYASSRGNGPAPPLFNRFNTLLTFLHHQQQQPSSSGSAAADDHHRAMSIENCQPDQASYMAAKVTRLSPQSADSLAAMGQGLAMPFVPGSDQPHRYKATSLDNVHGHWQPCPGITPSKIRGTSCIRDATSDATGSPSTSCRKPAPGPRTSAMLHSIGFDALPSTASHRTCRASTTRAGQSDGLFKMTAPQSSASKTRANSSSGSLECLHSPDIPHIKRSANSAICAGTHAVLSTMAELGAQGRQQEEQGLEVVEDSRGPSTLWMQASAHPAQAEHAINTPEDVKQVNRVAEVKVMVVPHPTLKASSPPLLLVDCIDVSARCAAEELLMQLTENQLGMVSQMFPLHIIEHLSLPQQEQQDLGLLARQHHDVTILFMDIVNFTGMSKEVKPWQVMKYLNEVFSLLDEVITSHGLHKVETAGDCYIVSGGVLEMGAGGFLQIAETHDPAANARAILACAKDMLHVTHQVPMPHNGSPTQIRIGIHTGDCTSGLIGSRLPKWSLYGDCVNTASRMESTSLPGRIQVTQDTHRLLPEESWQATGGVYVKGKGTMNTYLWMPSTSHELMASNLRSNMMNSTLPRITEGQNHSHFELGSGRNSSAKMASGSMALMHTFDLLSTGARTSRANTAESQVVQGAHRALEPDGGVVTSGSTSVRSSAPTISTAPSINHTMDSRALSQIASTFAAFRCQSSRRSIDVCGAGQTSEPPRQVSGSYFVEQPIASAVSRAGLQLIIPQTSPALSPSNQQQMFGSSTTTSPDGWGIAAQSRTGLTPAQATTGSKAPAFTTLSVLQRRAPPTKTISSLNLGASFIMARQHKSPSINGVPPAGAEESQINRPDITAVSGRYAAPAVTSIRPGKPSVAAAMDAPHGVLSALRSPSICDWSELHLMDAGGVHHSMSPRRQRRCSALTGTSPAKDFSLSALLNAAAWTTGQPPGPAGGR